MAEFWTIKCSNEKCGKDLRVKSVEESPNKIDLTPHSHDEKECVCSVCGLVTKYKGVDLKRAFYRDSPEPQK